MKKILVVLTCLSACVNAQETAQPWELGSTLFIFNTISPQNENTFYHEKPPLEIMNGLFFRYRISRFALRAQANYTEYSYSFSAPDYCDDCGSGSSDTREFRIGGGLQFSLTKSRDWLYAFVDLAYRNVYGTGTNTGGISNQNVRYTYTSNGTDANLGIGFRLKLFKSVYISPEIGYDHVYGFQKKTITDGNTGRVDKANLQMIDLRTLVQTHLTVRF